MKKAISLILVFVMCLHLCACGGSNSDTPETTEAPTEQKGTPLTLDNYDTYLRVFCESNPNYDDTRPLFSVQQHNGGNGMKTTSGYTWYLYPLARMYVFIEGASTNFNYFDIEVTIKFTITCQPGNPSTGEWENAETIEQLVTVNCDIGGRGFYQENTDLGHYLHSDMYEYQWEVVEITGYVDKA